VVGVVGVVAIEADKSWKQKQVFHPLDWFKGKLKPESSIFSGIFTMVSGFDFPLNQSNE